ncbi:MAG: DNA-binding transcriptional regulator [Capsulimonas sp.]|nr:DNA-binding transcriptional regulator [Capsulimonas sp.]
MLDRLPLPSLGRLLKILTLLCSMPTDQRIGRQYLADECGCNPRTIQRDIDLLILTDVPITYDHSKRTYFLDRSDWTYPIHEVTAEDVLALALARAALAPPGLPYASAVRRAIDKTSSTLPPGLKELLAQAREVILTGSASRDYSSAPFDLLMMAATAKRTVEIDYSSLSGGERRWRLIDPYGVKPRDGHIWEVHGWCHRRQAIRTFALNRVKAARMTDDVFVVREDEWDRFKDEKGVYGGLRGGERVEVLVQFTPEVAGHALEYKWPEGLLIAAQEDGSVILSGKVLGVDGVIPDILRWRRHAEVLGDETLRRRFIEELREMSQIYQCEE